MSSTASPAAVTVELIYLARLREAFGRAAERLAIAPRAAGAPQVEDVLAALVARGGAFAEELAPGRAVRVAVNHDVVAPGHPLRDGDEVALFPPVTGG